MFPPKPNKPAFERNPDVEKLINFLLHRDRASYAEMNAFIGRRLDGRDRYILAAARKTLERNSIIFVSEFGVGIVRATNAQVARLSTTHPIQKIRRITYRANKRQAHVNIQDLTDDERLAFFVGKAAVEILHKNTSRAFSTKLAKAVEKSGGEMLAIDQFIALDRLKRKGSRN